MVPGRLDVLTLNDNVKQIVFNFENKSSFASENLTKMHNVKNLNNVFALIHENIIFGVIDTKSEDTINGYEVVFFVSQTK